MTEGNGIGDVDPDALTPVTHKPLEPISHVDRKRLFGVFGYTWHAIPPTPYDVITHHAASPGDPEHVEISEIWKRQFLIKVDVPHIGKTCLIHRAIEKQFYGFWTALHERNLTRFVLTFNGAWASRYKRQTGTWQERYDKCKTLGEMGLSNHCWGTAFDINAQYNPLGKPPAGLGERGSVVELVPVAEEFGLFWGGHFASRADGMHFEAARIVE